jgi:hypothetical protein
MRKIAAAALAVALLLVLLAPVGLYLVGLSNVEGRPSPPMSTTNVLADGIELQRALRLKTPIVVRPSNPWIYIGEVLDDQWEKFTPDAGTYAAWLVAGEFNRNHLKQHQMVWWHLSGAALTIWVTRNWSSDQIVVAAAEVVRSSTPRVRKSE